MRKNRACCNNQLWSCVLFQRSSWVRFCNTNVNHLYGPEKGLFFFSLVRRETGNLTAKTVQSAALSFQSIDHIHGGYGLPLSVLGVGDGVADYVLQEDLEDTASFFINQTRNTLDATSSSQTSDCRLGNSLDVVAKNFPVTLGASFPQAFTAFASTRHVEIALTDAELKCWNCSVRRIYKRAPFPSPPTSPAPPPYRCLKRHPDPLRFVNAGGFTFRVQVTIKSDWLKKPVLHLWYYPIGITVTGTLRTET